MFRFVRGYLHSFDWVLFGATALLMMFGLAVLYSTSLTSTGGDAFSQQTISGDFSNFYKQASFVIVGLFLIFFFTTLNFRVLKNVVRPLYGLGIVMLVGVLVFGETIRGTRGWFQIAGFGIQPVEAVKLILILFLARFLSVSSRDPQKIRSVVGSAMFFIPCFLLVVVQPDLGSALLLFALWMILLFMSGMKRLHIIILLATILVAAGGAWAFVLKPYQKDRVFGFLDPSRDPRGRGYNVSQSIIAIGSGGWTGKGLGFGSQSQLRFLPERQTDFVFAVIAEELGFFGVLFVVALFAVIFVRCYQLTKTVHDDFALFVIFGIVSTIAIEMFVNIGGNLRLIPVTGIALPFVSYGGSSLLVKCCEIGILESIAMRK